MGDPLDYIKKCKSHIKRTLVSMSKRTGMTVSQVTDEVLYTGLLEMQEMDAQGYGPEGFKAKPHFT